MTDQGVILAAGVGSRLMWLTENQPKALMPIAGISAIARVIYRMVAVGIRHIAINLHHHGQQIQAALGDGSKFGVALYYSIEPELLNSGGGVRQALQLLPALGPILVHNADVCADIDLLALQHQQPEAGCTLAVVVNPSHHPDGDFVLQQGRLYISSLGLRYTYAGASYWQAEYFIDRPDASSFSLLEPIRQCIADNQCAAMLHRGHWFDIGRPSSLAQASRYYSTH